LSNSNSIIAALLRDLAAIQSVKQSAWGYRRAAAAVFDLEEPIEAYVQPDGTLRKIPQVGPKSERIALEVLRTGTSPTAERVIEASGKGAEIAVRRGLRENFLTRSEVLEALNDSSLTGPTLADYRGDLQMHSTWSDGSMSLDDIARAGIERGYQYSAVTDHSYGLRIAGGVPMADIPRQQAEIDEVNARHRGRFRLFKGIEANIRADGSVDMTPDELAQFEVVVAAPHSGLRASTDQTERMIAAVSTPGVHVLGHPRGRMYGSRPGVQANWDEVFAAAARTRVAIEIDGDPARQDVDFLLAPRALNAGCVLALDSDAHAADQLAYSETAIAHARLAGIPRERVINCWPIERFLDWISR
jgi:histidinol phosphatase-like PHP family hydrolase